MRKILIVDDEQISLMMANHILSTEYATYCAASGAEAVEAFEREHPDMVLSDLRMPGMTGFELQRTIKDKFNTNVPFMFMTADTDEETESKGFEQGAFDFIRKPFRADVLLRRVGNIISNVEQIQGLTKAAVTDPMTGLLNKASSHDEIGKMCKSTPGALMMVDLDSFKPVNDIYGHDMGDKILIRFAEILQSAVRATDITGRVGGDEFIAYCQNINDESVIKQKTEYINEQLLLSAKSLMGEDMSIPLGVSIGCVFAPEEGTDFLTLYKKADKALYNVKQNGKHGYSIYKASGNDDTEINTNLSGLNNVFTILNERNQAKGAYTLPMEQFRTVYQFLVRMTANYNKEIWILLLSLRNSDGSESYPAEVTESFSNVLSSSLRQSDVVTKNTKNQFIVLLLETTRSNIKLIVDRIETNWIATEYGSEYSMNYELDYLK
ncbi:MAG: diguanylate cyclase [Lachnospiraceae bacterium]|nr:diguanylate cyclase [Lachnospiraceae bacterium]